MSSMRILTHDLFFCLKLVACLPSGKAILISLVDFVYRWRSQSLVELGYCSIYMYLTENQSSYVLYMNKIVNRVFSGLFKKLSP